MTQVHTTHDSRVSTSTRDGHHLHDGHHHDESPAEIEAEIRRNRAEMDETIDALGRKLDPNRLSDQIWAFVSSKLPAGTDTGEVKDMAMEIPSRIGNAVARHPIPAALVGAGVLWLLAEEARGESGDTTTIRRGAASVSNKAHDLKDRASGAATDARDSARQTASSASSSVRDAASTASAKAAGAASYVGDTARHAALSTRDAATHAGHRVAEAGRHGWEATKENAAYAGRYASESYQRHPFAMCMAAFAAGTLAGVLTPKTRREEELIGPAAEKLRRQAADMATEVAERADEKAAEAIDRAEKQVEDRIDRRLEENSKKTEKRETAGGSAKAADRSDSADRTNRPSTDARTTDEGRVTKASDAGDRATKKANPSNRERQSF